MEEKKILFFGCSHTAGDELSDDDWFPWKKDAKTDAEYYKRRNETLRIQEHYERYSADNRKKAYPALIKLDGISIENHAHNGASLRECIYRCLRELQQHNFNVSAVYMQLPPPHRQMLLLSSYATSILSTNALEDDHVDQQKYVIERIKLFPPFQDSIDDIIDIVMLYGYLKQKNIRLFLIPIDFTLHNRLLDLTDGTHDHGFLLNLFSEIPVLDVRKHMTDRQLGHHFGKETHQKLSEIFSNHIRTEILR